MTREKKRLSLHVTSYTLVGGHDNPNCFSLAAEGGDVRIVNMKLGPFERVAAEFLRGGVDAEMLAPGVAILTDSRIPEHELHNDRWCTVCCRFRLLPEEQQRAYLRTWTPHFHDGRLSSWGTRSLGGPPRDDAAVEADLATLRASGDA